MADTKTTDLGSITPVATDVFYIVDDPGGTPASAKATIQGILNLAPVQSVAGETGTITAADLTTAITENVQDLIGAMFSGNTETLVTVTYQDGDGTIDVVVDNDLANYSNATSGFAVAATLASTSNGDGAALIGIEDSGGLITATTVEGALAENRTAIDAVESDIAGLATVATTGSYNDLSDTPTIPTVSDVAYDATTWNANTDAATKNAIRDALENLDAAKAEVSHNHAASAITTGTFADARIAESNVTQHEVALTITESQISDLGSYITDSSTTTFTNKTFDANGTGNSISNIEVADFATGVFLDEDDLNSDSATALASQQSIKAYVDAVAGGSSQEQVEDWVGAMFTGNTETGVTVTYQDGDGTIDVEVTTASTTAAGIAELATAAEVTAGTDTGRTITPDALAGSIYGQEVVTVCLFDDSEDVATGDGAGDQLFRVPAKLNGFNLVGVAAYHQTAGTGAGSDTTDVQIANVTDAVDMLSTKLTIDEDETDSSTAAAAAVINTANDDVATGDKLRFDVDALVTGTAPKGLWVEMTFQAP